MRFYGLAGLLLLANPPHTAEATLVPTSYEAGQFIATPTLASGTTLRLLVDTGGPGTNWAITGATVKALGLPTSPCLDTVTCIAHPTFAAGKGMPDMHPRGSTEVMVFPDGVGHGDQVGVTSGWYLASGTWTFDYPARRLSLQAGDWKPDSDAHPAPMGFMTNARGKLGAPYPRITVGIAGEPIDLLLDTGATAHPTVAGIAAEHIAVSASGYAAASYITTSVMNRWHAAHPDWPLVEDGDDAVRGHTRVIRVPSVAIAGWLTGPVWFTERPDANFDTHEGHMSSFMDEEVHGAAGGNIFAAFRMTLDYADRKAWFTCVTTCKPAP